VKPWTIHIIITIALVHKWSIPQLDIKNTFLHGCISRDIFMEQRPGMALP
jgi:hypothetical protein